MSIELITFDLDDTLWSVAPVLHAAEHAVQRWLAEKAPLSQHKVAQDWLNIRTELLLAQPDLKHCVTRLRLEVLHIGLERSGYSAAQASILAAQALEVFLEARHKVVLFPGVLPVLAALSQRYQLGTITNGNADIRRLNLAGYLGFSVDAESLGAGKPSTLPFARALAYAGVSSNQAVHVGDHPVDDIEGALNAGWQAIWFNPNALPWTRVVQPSAIIQGLDALADTVQQLSLG